MKKTKQTFDKASEVLIPASPFSLPSDGKSPCFPMLPPSLIFFFLRFKIALLPFPIFLMPVKNSGSVCRVFGHTCEPSGSILITCRDLGRLGGTRGPPHVKGAARAFERRAGAGGEGGEGRGTG